MKYRKKYFLDDKFAFHFYFFFFFFFWNTLHKTYFQAKCDLGNRIKETMESLDALERKSVETAMKKFLSVSCSYLLKNLPMKVPVIRHSRYLHPSKHAGSKAINAVGRLAIEVHNSLGNELFANVFGKAMPKHDFCHVIRKEMKEF